MTAASTSPEPASPRITATRNGPYQVEGVRRIVWREPVRTAAGEPVAWRTGEVVADEDRVYWLCRCGQSANKPFCDSSHRRVGFLSDDSADPGPREERTTSYDGVGVSIQDDRSLCSHAGFCATRSTNVWKMTPRVTDTEGVSQVVAMVQRCPSGALTVTVDGQDLESRYPQEVALVPDGPLWVTGGVPVMRDDGVQLEVRNRVTLCRCGQSRTKPWCDGSHAAAKFRHRPEEPTGGSAT